MLSNIRIVLVAPSHPGNIGAAARAMKTMGLKDLYLVSPQQYPHADANARASGADDVLEGAVVVDSLAAALADCTMVLGTSARLRSLQWPQLDPRQAATTVSQASAQAKVAFVFGRERTGLSNAELDLCHYLVHIPSNEAYSSLNLAAAVQVLSYEIAYAHQNTTDIRPADGQPLDTMQQDMQGFYEHLEQTLVRIEFMDPQQPKHLMRRLRRLFNRARPDPTEINILRGILSAVDKGVDRQ